MRLGAAALLLLAPGLLFAEWRGVDLSYVNELEDCGAVYQGVDGAADPYSLLAGAGANLVRLRLWVDPDWTDYSTLADVRKSIRRARAAGMGVLLDFHYSDDWAHPGKQLRPEAWPPAEDVVALADTLNGYTAATLHELGSEGLMPDIVAVGNEINTNLLVDEETPDDHPIDWPRNAVLLNAAIEAVRSASGSDSQSIGVMLHVAQPENVEGWFDDALANGVTDFDHIGISYYPKWSSVALDDLPAAVAHFRTRYSRTVTVVETAYPWTLDGNDAAKNLLGEDSLVPGYPATPAGQKAFLLDLRRYVADAGGNGVIYWEPAWISSDCETRWGDGSHWENAALFDFDNRLLPGAQFLAP